MIFVIFQLKQKSTFSLKQVYMEILFLDKNLNIKNIQYLCQDIQNLSDDCIIGKGGQGCVYEFPINNKKYAIKISLQKEFIDEVGIIKKIEGKLDKHFSKKFMAKHYAILKCPTIKDKNIFIMEKYCGDINQLLDNNDSLYPLLIQCMIAFWYLNHVVHVFHNDICFKENFHNIMYSKETFQKKVVMLKNYKIIIPCCDYIIKIIDFGWSSTRLEKLKPVEHKKHPLNDLPIKSEILFLLHCFFLYLGHDLTNELISLSKKIIKKVGTKSIDFDSYLIYTCTKNFPLFGILQE